MQRQLLNQRECLPSLQELQENYNKLDFTDAPHNADEIINDYLTARSYIANEAAFHTAYMRLFTLDWSRISRLFTSDEDKEPATKNSKSKNLYEATCESLQRDDVTQFEYNCCSQCLQKLEDNPQLKELLQNISSSGTVNKNVEKADKSEMMKFFREIQDYLEKSNTSVLKAWRKALYNYKTEGEDFLDILYQTLTNVNYDSSSKPILLLELTNSKLIDFTSPENSLKFQIFNMLYGSTLRQLTSLIELIFTNTTTQISYIFDPESKIPENNVAFPLINFKAFCECQKWSIKNSTKKLNELEFKLILPNKESDRSIYLLRWIMPKENNCALSAVKLLEQLVDKIDVCKTDSTQAFQSANATDSTHDFQSANTEADSFINDDENESEHPESSKQHDFKPWQKISDLCNTQAQNLQTLCEPVFINNIAPNESIGLTEDWTAAPPNNKKDKASQYSFILANEYKSLKAPEYNDNAQLQIPSLENLYQYLDNYVKNKPDEIVSKIYEAFLTFIPLYARCAYALYNGLLCCELVDPCIHAYCYILQELKALLGKSKYSDFAQKVQRGLINLGIAVSPFKDPSLQQAILLPWNVMQMHAAMLKQQNSLHNIYALLKEQQAARLIEDDVLIKNHRELLEHSYAPVLSFNPLSIQTHSKSKSPDDSLMLVQEETFNYGCALMLPLSNTTLFKKIQTNGQNSANLLCSELEDHYLAYFVPTKPELNILLYQCPSLDIVKHFFKLLLEKTQTKDASKEKSSQLKGLNVNLYVVYHNDNQETDNLLEQVYQSMCSYLDKDLMQTNLQLANSNEFKQNVQLFVMSEAQLKHKCKTALHQDNYFAPNVTDSSSLDKFFDIALLFDISNAQSDENNASNQKWIDMLQPLPSIEALDPAYLSIAAALKDPLATSLPNNYQHELSVANAVEYMPNLTSSLYLHHEPNQNNNFNFINSLVPHSASTAIKLYLSSLYRYNRIRNACIPYFNINKQALSNLLSFAHTYSKMVICIDNNLTKSMLQSCLNNKNQEHTLIFYQYNSKFHRNILISALFKSIEPLQEKILLDSINQECGANFNTSNELPSSIVKRAAVLSGRILVKAQNSKNSSRELIGIVCSSFLLERLQQGHAALLKDDNFSHGDGEWSNLFNAQLSLDENLYGLYQNQTSHADIIGVSAFFNEENPAQPYKLYLYVAESKFRSKQTDYPHAVEQLKKTCEPLNLLFYKDKLQTTKNEQADDQQGEQTSSNQSILKNMVLAWVHNTVIKAAEVCDMQEKLYSYYQGNNPALNNLFSAILKDQVDIHVLPVVFNFSLNQGGESVVDSDSFNNPYALPQTIRKYVNFKINKKDLGQLLNMIEAYTVEDDDYYDEESVINLPESLEALILQTAMDYL